jgi:hypothetical protein
MLWELVRHTARRSSRIAFLALAAFLSITTCIGWSVSIILADAYTVPTYIAFFLLIFRREFTTRHERWLLSAVAVWGMLAHTTHWLVAAGLCVLLALLSLTPWTELRGRRRQIGMAAALIVIAVLSQVALHRFLYGKASLNGPSPPYLMARVIADGTGARYLQEHCGTLNWVICKHVDTLPRDAEAFLWADKGVWTPAFPAEREALRKEEGPLVKATILAYPGAQLHQSWRNFRQQMGTFSVYDLTGNAQWIGTLLAPVVPNGVAPYNRSLQSHGLLPVQWISTTQETVYDYSVVALLVLLPLAWLRNRQKMQALSVVALSALLLNAAVCAVLSCVAARYMARVVWLVPMLAASLAWDLFQLRPVDPETVETAISRQ